MDNIQTTKIKNNLFTFKFIDGLQETSFGFIILITTLVLYFARESSINSILFIILSIILQRIVGKIREKYTYKSLGYVKPKENYSPAFLMFLFFIYVCITITLIPADVIETLTNPFGIQTCSLEACSSISLTDNLQIPTIVYYIVQLLLAFGISAYTGYFIYKKTSLKRFKLYVFGSVILGAISLPFLYSGFAATLFYTLASIVVLCTGAYVFARLVKSIPNNN